MIVRIFSTMPLLALLAVLGAGSPADAQEVRIRDVTTTEWEVPVRLVGYGLVVGLDGSGDRVIGGFSAGHTVRSVANLLRRFNVEVPEELLRTRNVAAVLVTAETSPFLRPGGRFEVTVASIGDAVSLRGGVLWTTPLLPGSGGGPVATAQGSVLVSDDGGLLRADGRRTVETSARIPEGGLLEVALPDAGFAETSALQLRRPDLATAHAIAETINATLGEEIAAVRDPGSVELDLPAEQRERVALLSEIGSLPVAVERSSRIVIDGRTGTVVAGGPLRVGESVVSHGTLTLSVGPPGAQVPAEPGDLRVEPGATVQEVASALHAVAATPEAIASVFDALHRVGALSAEVIVR